MLSSFILVNCQKKSMIHIIIDRQIAYVCETDQMVEFHTILTLIFNSDDLNLATLNSGAFLI